MTPSELALESTIRWAECQEQRDKLRAENARLRELLRPFAEMDGGDFRDCCPLWLAPTKTPGTRPTIGDCRRAKEALERKP